MLNLTIWFSERTQWLQIAATSAMAEDAFRPYWHVLSITRDDDQHFACFAVKKRFCA